MTGETDLDRLIQAMQPVLHPDLYVFATVKEPSAGGLPPAIMTFREAEGTTLILTAATAQEHGLRHDFPCRMITLNIHSALEAVGFLARITNALAAADMGVNPVSAFFHDHLFVPADRAKDAMAVLAKLSEGGAP